MEIDNPIIKEKPEPLTQAEIDYIAQRYRKTPLYRKVNSPFDFLGGNTNDKDSTNA